MLHTITLPQAVASRYPLFADGAGHHVEIISEDDSGRLPAYDYEGLSQIPVPVFRWKRGQKIDQTLVDLQVHLFDRILHEAPAAMTTLFAREGAYVRMQKPLPVIPEADIVCFGIWADPTQPSSRRVFCLNKSEGNRLESVYPTLTAAQLTELIPTHFTLLDAGLWLATSAAAARLHERDIEQLIGEFRIAVVPLDGAEFYPFATTRDMVRSTLALQNAVQDQRLILHKTAKAVPSLFTQNARVEVALRSECGNIWIENSHVPATWSVTTDNVVTGVPVNDWSLHLRPGQCVRVLPLVANRFAATVYEYDDASRQRSAICSSVDELGTALQCLLDGISGCPNNEVTCADIDFTRLKAQRQAFQNDNLGAIARNYRKSVFYQVNLKDMADKFASNAIPAPTPVGMDEPQLVQIRDAMFHAQLKTLRGEDGSADEQRAFALLQDGLTEPAFLQRQTPHLDVYRDQIVWGRSAVRIDVAGGWTDTPPYCINTGGNVVNLAIELNGQQPLQVYVKPCKELKVICRSIDLGATEVLETYEELRQFNKVGSPFSIPKAALALCGFLPQFAEHPAATLRRQLEEFGSGIEITLLSAIPAGSGLGTSSILAATVLGALSDFCGLGWDKSTICNRTLILEQLLTTGGGWQDQYGGVLHGVKLLQTGAGFDQTPVARWLPDQLWTDAEMRQCHLLYYTGITRTAKHILAEIVRGMFLNNTEHLTILGEMKQQALDMFDAIQRNDIELYGRLVRRTWSQNKALDSGTEPPLVADLCSKIDDLCAGYKLPGAGGGGYLYMVAKDPEAAARIKRILMQHPLTDSSRFVEMTLSKKGLQVSRS